MGSLRRLLEVPNTFQLAGWEGEPGGVSGSKHSFSGGPSLGRREPRSLAGPAVLGVKWQVP